MNILAIIPARGGSQGIPKKNITPVAGKPLINYTIKVAQQSERINKIVVSSDNDEILDVAKIEGVVAIKRPVELAGHNSKMDGAINHVLTELNNQGYKADLVVLLQPTSPLRSIETLNTAIDVFIENQENFDSLIPLAPTSNKVGITENNVFKPMYPAGVQRQELTQLYYDCGTVHIFKPEVLIRGDFFGKNIFAFPIPWPESLDIDSHDDLDLAEYYLQKLRK